jgi:NAD(P)-dependent dehydrogenase (short-subunit alcohol dehydrogenase family)
VRAAGWERRPRGIWRARAREACGGREEGGARADDHVDPPMLRDGRIDEALDLLNNAGLMPLSPLERGKIEDWDRMIDVNLIGGHLDGEGHSLAALHA